MRSLFRLAHRLDAFRADRLLFSINALGLKIDLEFSLGGDIGMGSALAGFGSAAANVTSCHMIAKKIADSRA